MTQDNDKPVTDEVQRLLKEVVDHFDKEDRAVRERQIRQWRKLKLYWEGYEHIWYSETAHDWRIFDQEKQEDGDADQSYYDKPVNIFRAFLETIIAALSTTVPGVYCFPDDADNAQDTETAKAGNRIYKLLARHNNAQLLWLHALFIWCTEGLLAAYTYPKEDESYGTFEKKQHETTEEEQYICPQCGGQVPDALLQQSGQSSPSPMGLDGSQQQQGGQPNTQESPDDFTADEEDEYSPSDGDVALHDLIFNQHEVVCEHCGAQLDPDLQKTTLSVTRLVGITNHPKTRQCVEVYGGLNVKVPNYATKQEDCPYLILAYESHYANVLKMYPELDYDKMKPGGSLGGMYDPYERWGRLNPQYNGEYPLNNVTVRNCWLRPAAFNVLDKASREKLARRFPDGAKVVFVNDTYAEAEDEALDDVWTLSRYPLADYIHHDPAGMLLVNIQDITNDIISLTLQTIEQGIPQTFADPGVVNFDQYRQMEVAPGMLIPTKPARAGQSIEQGFYTAKTAQLSGEVLPFYEKIQQLGQFTSGALPSLFGGAISESKTASEYSMSRAQALQRLQNTWTTLRVWWKELWGKAIPSYIKCMSEDEKYVERDKFNNFVNVFIRRSELAGKIGQVELEANDNLPTTWDQRRQVVMQFLQAANPAVMQALMAPENIELLKEAFGLDDFVLPGEDDRTKQNEEIQQLVNSSPIEVPQPQMDPAGHPIMGPNGPAMQPVEQPSIGIDQDIDNHGLEADICRRWLVGDAGRLAKTENPEGYRNVLLHLKAHLMAMQPPPGTMPQQPQQGDGQQQKPQNDKAAAPLTRRQTNGQQPTVQ